jgi:DDRGK domain
LLINYLQEEEAVARKAKEEEAAALEFEKWKDAFSVDAEGTTENDSQDDGQGLLHNFVEYIKVCIKTPSHFLLHVLNISHIKIV